MTRILMIVLLLLLSITWIFSAVERKRERVTETQPDNLSTDDNETVFKKLRTKADSAKRYIRQKGFNESVGFMLDMSMHSGKNRFFVYDLKKDSVLNAAPVTHGRCNEAWLEGRRYDNTVGSGCTSLGRYKIGKPYQGRFGLAYKLHGLDRTNHNAFKRYVVLHGHECVPASEINEEICQSDGCPTVSPSFLQYLKPVIERSSKPVLLWIYE